MGWRLRDDLANGLEEGILSQFKGKLTWNKSRMGAEKVDSLENPRSEREMCHWNANPLMLLVEQ